MSQLMTMGQQAVTMSSQEIADLVESRHDSVKRAIERLAEKGLIQLSPLVEVRNHLGQTVSVYRLEKRDSYVVVAQLSPEFTARLVDRWQELEAQQTPVHAIPQTLAQALRLAAEQAEQIEQLAFERDEAKRTKAEIGSKREATAMATASAAKREAAQLRHELGRNQQHATVVAVEKATGRNFGKSGFVPLRRVTKAYGLTAVQVMDPRWGAVKAWPAIAWREAYGIELSDLFASQEAA